MQKKKNTKSREANQIAKKLLFWTWKHEIINRSKKATLEISWYKRTSFFNISRVFTENFRSNFTAVTSRKSAAWIFQTKFATLFFKCSNQAVNWGRIDIILKPLSYKQNKRTSRGSAENVKLVVLRTLFKILQLVFL